MVKISAIILGTRLYFTLFSYASRGYRLKILFEDSSSVRGDLLTLSDQWQHPEAIPVAKVVFHPMYDADSYEFNVAVLELQLPALDIVPIMLAHSSCESHVHDQ